MFFNPFKSVAESHYVDGGSVYCPVRKADLEIDSCFACGRLLEVQEDKGRVRVIRCSASGPVRPFSGIR